MKVLLVTLDSKFIHANLAVRYLKNFCENDGYNIEIKEFTINQQIDYILNEIFDFNPDIICFSCYIWNIQYVKEIAYIIIEAKTPISILGITVVILKALIEDSFSGMYKKVICSFLFFVKAFLK